jgi:hypothetical protein
MIIIVSLLRLLRLFGRYAQQPRPPPFTFGLLVVCEKFSRIEDPERKEGTERKRKLMRVCQMRTNMDPLNPMASMLDPKIAQIYAQASSIRDALREEVPEPDEHAKRKQRTRELAAEVLAMPQKLQDLVDEGRVEEAREAWMKPRRLLLLWKAKGLGGPDVQRCLEVGDGVFEESESEDGSGSEVEST